MHVVLYNGRKTAAVVVAVVVVVVVVVAVPHIFTQQVITFPQ